MSKKKPKRVEHEIDRLLEEWYKQLNRVHNVMADFENACVDLSCMFSSASKCELTGLRVKLEDAELYFESETELHNELLKDIDKELKR